MTLLDEREAAVPGETVAAPTTSRPVTDAGALWRRVRLPLAVLLAVVTFGLVAAGLEGSGSGGDLDPTSFGPGGSRAVASLLAQRGIRVSRVGAPVPGTTNLVPDSGLLGSATLHGVVDLARTDDVVVVVDDDASADSLGVGLEEGGYLDDDGDPHCAFGPAVAAANAHLSSMSFADVTPRGFSRAYTCYGRGGGGHPRLLALRPDHGTGSLVLLTGSALLRNDRLAEEGDAALAVGLLDHGRPVSWVQPRATEAGSAGADGGTPVLSLLPHRLVVALWELLVAGVLLALWRARRLGPVVVERLPVVVRAVETVQGRARLYRSAHARDRAALALQEAARARLARGLGLGVATTAAALVQAVAARSGRSDHEVSALLYGAGAPPDDPALVAFAADLDNLVTAAVPATVDHRQTGGP